MSTPRPSTSSDRSGDATVVDQDFVPSSPKMYEGDEEQCISHGNARSSFQSHGPTSNRSSFAAISEHNTSVPKHGWPQLAEKMAEVPEYAAFPRFKDLNVKNLLYFQVQLKALRMKISKQEDKEDQMRNLGLLAENADSKYHQLLMELRGLLREYIRTDEAVIQYSQVSAMPDPDSYNMSSLRRWIMSERGANNLIYGSEGPDDTWGDLRDPGVPESLLTQFWLVLRAIRTPNSAPHRDLNLVVTHPENKLDGLTKWIVYNLTPFYWAWQRKREVTRMQTRQGRGVASEGRAVTCQIDEEKHIVKAKLEKEDLEDRITVKTMSESTVLRLTAAFSTVVASLTPVIAITILSQVSGMRSLLLTITALAVVFAVLLIILTQGTSSRTEIFAATAAFSAVLVVFISQPAINIQMPPGTNTPIVNL